MKKIAILASGSGSNAQKIIEYFEEKDDYQVAIVLSNKSDAYVLERADNFEIPGQVFSRNEFYDTENVLALLKRLNIDLIALAGFLWKVPQYLIDAFPKRIINLHPALLPLHGGKGMYGKRVHQAVLESGDKETGITIHYVNENYDEGQIIGQYRCPVSKEDTIDTLAFKVQQLEHQYYPKALFQAAKKL
ncbi:MAG: phosphoribosylglycinamide formyltransferase-1 [Sphingobacteriales bacterium]